MRAVAAIAVLGTRQLALAVLMHESSHRTLFRTRWMNDWAGRLCGWAIWQHSDRYRIHHMNHHRFTGSDRDPDLAAGLSLRDLLETVEENVLGMNRLVGTYVRD